MTRTPAALGGLELALLCREWGRELADARVQEALLCRSGDLALQLRLPGRTRYLRLGVLPEAQWIYCADNEPSASKTGSPLRDKCRALVGGGRLLDLSVPRWRRMVLAAIERDGRTYRVVWTAEPPLRAIVVLDETDTIRAGVGSLRGLAEGDRFPLSHEPSGVPPGDTAACRAAVGEALAAEDPARALAGGIAGLSRPLARALLARAGDGTCAGTLCDDLARLADHALSPVVYFDRDGTAAGVLPLALEPEPGSRVQPYPHYTDAVAAYWESVLPILDAERLRKRITARLRQDAKRCRRTEEAVRGEHEQHRTHLNARRTADLLAASFHLLRRGMDAVEVPDYTAPNAPAVRIPLDPLLAPKENLERLYKQAQRAERGAAASRTRLDQLSRERERLEAQLDEASGPAEAERLRELAAALGLDPDAPPHLADAARAAAPPRALPAGVRLVLAPGGHEVYIGRTAAGNDTVLRRFARGNDLWLHVEGATGSHVVIRRRNKAEAIPEATIRLAAVAAATFSDRKKDAAVSVAVTEVKNVRKRKGDPPGRATYTHERVLLVEPDRKVLERFEESV